MARIYISYSIKDADFVSRVAEALRNLGHEPFYAHGGISPGTQHQPELFKKLREADAVLFVLSSHSVESRYVMGEIGSALGYLVERGRPIVIPLLLQGGELPKQLSHIQALFANNLTPEDVAIEVAAAIELNLGRTIAIDERKEAVRTRVEENAAKFIETSLAALKDRELNFRRAAYFWYAMAYVSLAVGVGVAAKRAFVIATGATQWIDFAAFALAGVVILGLLFAIARFAFMLGKSFMVESLRNSDRIHAISFGDFYLRAFPDKLDWENVKDAFQHWNIDKGSSFLTQSHSDFDHEVFRTAIAIAEAMKGAEKKK